MASVNNSSNEITPQINMVPLIDILLVLLIIFMLTANVIKEKKIPISLPKASTGESIKEQKGFSITIDDKYNYYLNGNKSDYLGIIDKLKTQDPEKVIVAISADKSIKYESIIKVINGLREISINNYALNIEVE